MHALHYANELLVRVRLILLKTFTSSLNIQKQYEKNVWETSNDMYSLLVRVQGRVVRKPVNANPRLKLTEALIFLV